MKKVPIIMRCVDEEIYLKRHREYEEGDIKIVNCGYLEFEDDVNVLDEEIWHWCNWSCWTSEKPKECEHLLIEVCNSDMSYCIDGIWYSHAGYKFSSSKECFDAMKDINQNNRGY